jgi:nitroreductase
MTDVVPSRKDVEELIDAAVWAPNHRFTQPWRFFVVAGDERERISSELAETVSLDVDALVPENAKRIEKARSILLQAPVVIAVTSVLNDDPEV